jgi:hypothetical protein
LLSVSARLYPWQHQYKEKLALWVNCVALPAIKSCTRLLDDGSRE